MIDFIKSLFKRRGRSTSNDSDYRADPRPLEFAKKIVEAAGYTQDGEFSCDEVLDLIDQYAEMVARGEDAAKMMPLIKHHLEMCIDCSEEYEALMRVLNSIPV